MTYVVLDIGAGSLAFAKDLRTDNPKVPMLILCGEPEWGIGPFFRPVASEKIQGFLHGGKSGIKRLNSSYQKFEVPDASLDLVTLNAPHPFMFGSIRPIYLELIRCLKPGGLFFSSFPRANMAPIPKDFIELATGRWKSRPDFVDLDRKLLPVGAPSRFPQSPTVRSNILTHKYGNPRAMGTSYIYFDGISPGWILWQKPN